ncbi:MAG: DUF4129 domain-containing protein, partial [Acidimicrobiales bacterium]
DRRDPLLSTPGAWRSASWVLAAAGAHRRRSETHIEFVDRVRRLGVLTHEANEALEALAHRMDRALYAPSQGGVAEEDSKAAWSESATIRRSARRRISWWQQVSLLVDPRDLLGWP